MRNKKYDPQEFYNLMYTDCKGYVEIRELPPIGNNQNWVRPNEVIELVSKLRPGNIYHGCATRKKGGGNKEACIEVPYLWIDIDFKDMSQRRAIRLLNEFKLKPTIIIRSGGGLHCYWKLRKPFLIKKTADILYVEGLLKRLTYFFNADMQSAELARGLRVPGTLNYKYDPPKDVYISFINGRTRSVR